MPFAIALLTHPLGSYCLLITALAGGIYALHMPGAFVIAFAGTAAGLLTLLAYLSAPPDGTGLAALGLGLVLLNLEFRVPTYGLAGAAGLAAATLGSWWLLATGTVSIAAGARLLIAVGGALALFITVGFALRRHTLPH